MSWKFEFKVNDETLLEQEFDTQEEAVAYVDVFRKQGMMIGFRPDWVTESDTRWTQGAKEIEISEV